MALAQHYITLDVQTCTTMDRYNICTTLQLCTSLDRYKLVQHWTANDLYNIADIYDCTVFHRYRIIQHCIGTGLRNIAGTESYSTEPIQDILNYLNISYSLLLDVMMPLNYGNKLNG